MTPEQLMQLTQSILTSRMVLQQLADAQKRIDMLEAELKRLGDAVYTTSESAK